MKIVLGIDIGASTTKIVGLSEDRKIYSFQLNAEERSVSGFDMVYKFLNSYNFSLSDISSIALTGVGSCDMKDEICGIKVYKVDEFNAIGYGGLYISKKNQL
ncbi:hypothetical protein [Candidatus Arthromitus sp. SFB-rat-Yit]|uniref:hypothetical protein n=1 Tax=Candidatus Arthromitus sp. SFB-rat-Yit TaxID=1041504 RepID=UPI000305D672|nr:hypothetical protein [Candidatus Arthromitus sp. SFB-rat-Yit]